MSHNHQQHVARPSLYHAETSSQGSSGDRLNYECQVRFLVSPMINVQPKAVTRKALGLAAFPGDSSLGKREDLVGNGQNDLQLDHGVREAVEMELA